MNCPLLLFGEELASLLFQAEVLDHALVLFAGDETDFVELLDVGIFHIFFSGGAVMNPNC
jgi:hypothetical protein